MLTGVVVRRDGRARGHVLDEDGARAAVLRDGLFYVEAPLVESSFGRHFENLCFYFFERRLYVVKELDGLVCTGPVTNTACAACPSPLIYLETRALNRGSSTGRYGRDIAMACPHMILRTSKKPIVRFQQSGLRRTLWYPRSWEAIPHHGGTLYRFRKTVSIHAHTNSPTHLGGPAAHSSPRNQYHARDWRGILTKYGAALQGLTMPCGGLLEGHAETNNHQRAQMWRRMRKLTVYAAFDVYCL